MNILLNIYVVSNSKAWRLALVQNNCFNANTGPNHRSFAYMYEARIRKQHRLVDEATPSHTSKNLAIIQHGL